MRVLFLGSDVFAKGGIPRYAVYQIKALKEIYGEDNVFVFSLAAYNPENAFEERIKTDYIQGGISLFDKLTFTLKVIGFIKKKKIDLVINSHIQLAIVSYLAKKIFGVRYVTNVYGIEIWSGLKKRDIIGLLNSDLIIGDCNFILKYIKDNFDINDEKLRLLHDPVDLNRFMPIPIDDKLFDKYAIPKNKFIVMTVGRLDIYKGYEMIIRTMPLLPEYIVYVVVGDGPDKEKLLDIRRDLKLESRVIFTLRVPEEELVPLYNLCDVFALVSRFALAEGEGLPLALIEAGACGKPIICGNQDGSVDAVDEGVNGFIISPDDKEVLKQRIMTLYGDKNLRKRMGEAGRKFVTDNFEYSKFRAKLAAHLKLFS